MEIFCLEGLQVFSWSTEQIFLISLSFLIKKAIVQ